MTIITTANRSSTISTANTSEANFFCRSPRSVNAFIIMVVDDMESMPPRKRLLMLVKPSRWPIPNPVTIMPATIIRAVTTAEPPVLTSFLKLNSRPREKSSTMIPIWAQNSMFASVVTEGRGLKLGLARNPATMYPRTTGCFIHLNSSVTTAPRSRMNARSEIRLSSCGTAAEHRIICRTVICVLRDQPRGRQGVRRGRGRSLDAKLQKMRRKIWWLAKNILTLQSQKASVFAGTVAPRVGPFVYRLGRKIFILERGVRFSYGLPSRRAEFYRTPLFSCSGWGRHSFQKSELKDFKDHKVLIENILKIIRPLRILIKLGPLMYRVLRKSGYWRELQLIGKVGLLIFLGFLNFAADFECKGIHFWFSTI